MAFKLSPELSDGQNPMEYELLKPVSIKELEGAGVCERELHRFAFLLMKDMGNTSTAYYTYKIPTTVVIRVAKQCKDGIRFLLGKGFILKKRDKQIRTVDTKGCVMDKLKRYSPLSTNDEVGPDFYGDYVLYADAAAKITALEKRCAELEAEIDSVKGCHNGYDPEMQKLGASEPTSLKVAAQELIAEMGSYWGVELNRRIEVERQRDCLADELDALAVELIERDKRMVCNCKLQNEIEGYYEVESQNKAKMRDKGNCGSRISDK